MIPSDNQVKWAEQHLQGKNILDIIPRAVCLAPALGRIGAVFKVPLIDRQERHPCTEDKDKFIRCDQAGYVEPYTTGDFATLVYASDHHGSNWYYLPCIPL